MIKIDRYINYQVLMAMGVVLLVLSGLDLIFTLVDELSETGGNYGVWEAFRYVLYIFPRHVYELLPLVALIGALIGLGIVASANELVVLQTSGVRVVRIIWAVMKPALLVMVAGLFLGEFVAPRLILQGETDRALARGGQASLSRYGQWQRDGRDFMHFIAIDPDGVLRGITIYSFTAGKSLASMTTAESAVYTEEDEGGEWLLQNGTDRIFRQAGEDENAVVRTFDSKVWNVDLSPDLLKVLIIEPDRMSISDLYRYASRFDNQGLDAAPYFLSFWEKVLQPLTTAALVIVAVSFIFGPLRTATMGSRLFTAICFGILFYLLQNLLGTVSLVYQLNPLVAAVGPILLCLLIGGILLRRTA